MATRSSKRAAASQLSTPNTKVPKISPDDKTPVPEKKHPVEQKKGIFVEAAAHLGQLHTANC